jgi:hypothetical protein
VKLQIVASLTDVSRGVIYDCNILILQATGTYKGGAESTPILIAKMGGLFNSGVSPSC